MNPLWPIRILFLSLCVAAGYAISQVRPEYVGQQYGDFIGMVIGFLISATMIRALIKRPDGSALGFGRACVVALVQALIGLAILVVVGGGLYLLGHALGFGARPPVSM